MRVPPRLARFAAASSQAALLPMFFFGALLASRLTEPHALSFDEIHYIPAAKSLIGLQDNLNWVHPPLGKLILGAGWLVLTRTLHLLGEPEVFRLISSCFGLWALWSVRALMLALGFSAAEALLALWLTGFNFLWFVQSKIAMLDIFCLAFCLWGTVDLLRASASRTPDWRFWRGFVWLGLASSAKWSAAPYFLIAALFWLVPRGQWRQPKALLRAALGVAVSAAAYLATYLPLAFLASGAVSVSELWFYHQKMLGGFDSIAAAQHPYLAAWWKWPLVLRPMWYTFESGAGGDRGVWAAVSPVLAWTSFPLLFVAAWIALRRRSREAAVLSVLYWVPLLFWAVAPRKLQLFYYYLPSSMMLGPIIVWAHRRFFAEIRETRGWLLIGFTLLCAAAFVYFLPIMDFRLLGPGRFYRYMWFESWI